MNKDMELLQQQKYTLLERLFRENLNNDQIDEVRSTIRIIEQQILDLGGFKA